jgi:hypothetical protein
MVLSVEQRRRSNVPVASIITHSPPNLACPNVAVARVECHVVLLADLPNVSASVIADKFSKFVLEIEVVAWNDLDGPGLLFFLTNNRICRLDPGVGDVISFKEKKGIAK